MGASAFPRTADTARGKVTHGPVETATAEGPGAAAEIHGVCAFRATPPKSWENSGMLHKIALSVILLALVPCCQEAKADTSVTLSVRGALQQERGVTLADADAPAGRADTLKQLRLALLWCRFRVWGYAELSHYTNHSSWSGYSHSSPSLAGRAGMAVGNIELSAHGSHAWRLYRTGEATVDWRTFWSSGEVRWKVRPWVEIFAALQTEFSYRADERVLEPWTYSQVGARLVIPIHRLCLRHGWRGMGAPTEALLYVDDGFGNCNGVLVGEGETPPDPG